MKWPSLEESVALCICLLTVARNREMQPFCFWLFVVGGGGGLFRVRAQNLTVPLGSGQTISGTGQVRASILSLCRPLARSKLKLYYLQRYIISHFMLHKDWN